MASGGQKSEKASVQRLRKAREQGQFLVSRGFVGAVQFVAAIALLSGLVSTLRFGLEDLMLRSLQRSFAGEITPTEWPALLRRFSVQSFTPLLEFLGILLTITMATHLGISRLGFSVQRLAPNFNKLNPLSKLKQMPAQNLRSVIEATVLLTALAAIINSLVQQDGASLLRLSLASIPSATEQITASLKSLLWKAAALFVVFGAVDLFRQQRKYMSDLRMSKEEVREENKRMEGSPQMKARIRRIRRDWLRKRMTQDAAKATAVVVNPTHFAVAIRYEADSMACPLVVAKGKNWLALKIRKVALDNQIPIIENPPLARALYDAVEVGRAISPEFYKAIAEILAYVYRVMGRRLAQ